MSGTIHRIILNYSHSDELKEGGPAKQVGHTSSKRLWNFKQKPPQEPSGTPLMSPSAASPSFFGDSVTSFGPSGWLHAIFHALHGEYHSKRSVRSRSASPVNLEQNGSLLTKESLLSTWGLERRYRCQKSSFSGRDMLPPRS